MRRNNLEDKIKSLEEKLLKKEELLENIYKNFHAAQIFPIYLHDMKNILFDLACNLTHLFKICKNTNPIKKLKSYITRDFEDLQDHFKYYQFFTNDSLFTESSILMDCIHNSVKAFEQKFKEHCIFINVNVCKISAQKKVPNYEIQLIIRICLLNALLFSFQNPRNKNKIVAIESTFEEDRIKLIIKDYISDIRIETVDKNWSLEYTSLNDKLNFGLFIIKKLVENIGGHISFESKIGEFIQFVILLSVMEV
jgi:light-regulated signal transduction histidine kinase (bacteriophytochrome)